MGKKELHEYGLDDYVPLLFARNQDEADFYRVLLEDHDIPVVIADEAVDELDLPDTEEGIAVLVPEENLAEAEDIIEQRAELDDEFSEHLEDHEFNDCEDDDEFDGFDKLDADGESFVQLTEEADDDLDNNDQEEYY